MLSNNEKFNKILIYQNLEELYTSKVSPVLPLPLPKYPILPINYNNYFVSNY